MSPETAEDRARGWTVRQVPPASILGWIVETEPDSPFSEQWLVAAQLPAGVIDEGPCVYLVSLTTGEAISSRIDELTDCRIAAPEIKLAATYMP